MTGAIDFLRRQMLPVGLLTVAIIGLVWPMPGRAMGQLPTQYIAVSAIFICSGLLLRTDEIRAALRAWRATTWGVLAILFITPAIGGVLAFRMPMDPAFQLGLALFVCMPTTLSSGIALTTQARGNTALALLLTVVTNLAGIFTIPFVLVAVLGTLGQIELSAWDLLIKLCLSILLPLMVGRWLRKYFAAWVDANRARITMFSNLALISIPWMKFSESSDRLAAVAVSNLLVLVAAGLFVHAVFLALNMAASAVLRLEPAQRKAVVLMASQKTLPVALTVLALIPDSAVSADIKGLIAIPCITSHLGQIFVDAILATRWSGGAPA
ncbi:MAG: bile acid:sodium symporter [bacterium]|nr:bile acid:sodium symporter [bacterium]